MRTDKLTQRSMEALQISQELARGRNHNRLESAHLALALLESGRKPGGHAAEEGGGSDPARVREGLEAALDKLPAGYRRRRVALRNRTPSSAYWTER